MIEGIFASELPNRFRAKVLVQGRMVPCYIPTTTKLTSLLPMSGRRVRLVSGEKGLMLESLFYRNAWIGLNSSMANKVWFANLAKTCNGLSNLTMERVLEGYKFDVFDEGTNTAYEVKSIIGVKKEVDYPCVHSERMCDQLDRLEAISGLINISFILIALSPFVRCVRISDRSPFGCRLKRLVSKGMGLAAYRLCGSISDGRLESIRVMLNYDVRQRRA